MIERFDEAGLVKQELQEALGLNSDDQCVVVDLPLQTGVGIRVATPDYLLSANLSQIGSQPRLEIDRVGVINQNQGKGRRLVTAIEEIAGQWGCTSARTNDVLPRSRGFWKKLGYKALTEDGRLLGKELGEKT
jgi:GNAT superfamily N-acetyltransferase